MSRETVADVPLTGLSFGRARGTGVRRPDPASPQPIGDGRVEAAEFRHGFADDRRIEGG